MAWLLASWPEDWAAAPAAEQATALRILAANETMNFALASLFNILFAGVAFILFGLAVAASDGYPRWLGLLVVLGGLESISAGFIQAEAGEPLVAREFCDHRPNGHHAVAVRDGDPARTEGLAPRRNNVRRTTAERGGVPVMTRRPSPPRRSTT